MRAPCISACARGFSIVLLPGIKIPNQQGTKEFDYKDVVSPADAFIHVTYQDFGYFSPAFSGEYQPTIKFSIRLVDSKSKEVVFKNTYWLGSSNRESVNISWVSEGTLTRYNGLASLKINSDAAYRTLLRYQELMAKRFSDHLIGQWVAAPPIATAPPVNETSTASLGVRQNSADAVVDVSAVSYPPVITALMGENGTAQMATTARTSSPGVPSIQGTYIERQLTGEGMRTHFVNLGTVSGHSPGGEKMLYVVGQDGSLEIQNVGKGGSIFGSYKIKDAENQICIGIYASKAKTMQGCYRLFQVGADMFAMRSVSDNYYFTYAAPQSLEANSNPPAASASIASSPAVPAASSSGLPTEKNGQYSYQTEHIAKAQSCSTAPYAILNAKGPGFEAYTVSCDNGDALAMRCEFGQCRVLK